MNYELSGLPCDQPVFILFCMVLSLHQFASGLLVVQFPPFDGSMLTEKSCQLLAVLPVSEMCCVHVLNCTFWKGDGRHCDGSHF